MIALIPEAGDAKIFSVEDFTHRPSYLRSNDKSFEEPRVHHTLALVSYPRLYSDDNLLT